MSNRTQAMQIRPEDAQPKRWLWLVAHAQQPEVAALIREMEITGSIRPVHAERVIVCDECDLPLGGLGECFIHGDFPSPRVVYVVEGSDIGETWIGSTIGEG